MAESEDLAEMIDKSMVKVLNKEIKELEKYKAKTQKIYEKMTGGAKEEVIDENYDLNEYETIDEGPLEDKAAADSKKAEAAGVAYATAKAAAAASEEAAKKAEAAA